jgi:hypothetical protein
MQSVVIFRPVSMIALETGIVTENTTLVLVLRWFLDGTRVAQLATDNQLSRSTAYRYLHEGIDVLAAAAPSLHGALLAARIAQGLGKVVRCGVSAK